MAHTVPHSCLSARTMCVSSPSGNVMETMTVETVQMRSCISAVSQHKRSQVQLSLLNPESHKTSYELTSYELLCCCKVFLRPAVSVHPQWTSSARLRSVSAVKTIAASTATSCVTLSMTVVTAPMRNRKTVRVMLFVIYTFIYSDYCDPNMIQFIYRFY